MTHETADPEGLFPGGLRYRPAEVTDAEAIQLVIERAVTARRSEPIPTHVLSQEAVKRNEIQLSKDSTWSRLVFDGSRLIGLAIGTPATNLETGETVPNREHLNLLMIDPEYWSKGIGGGLLDWVDSEMVGRGVKSIDLWTGSDNQPARNLYEKKGYHTTGMTRAHPIYGEPQVQFEKYL